jgi:5-methylcytosine-specific restriction endonuclease McrA
MKTARGLKRNKPMNRVSDKHRKELKEYSKIRYDYFMLNHFCEICGNAATDIHHKARRGKNLNNTETWMPVCRPCHTKIESNGKWARENGYLQ